MRLAFSTWRRACQPIAKVRSRLISVSGPVTSTPLSSAYSISAGSSLHADAKERFAGDEHHDVVRRAFSRSGNRGARAIHWSRSARACALPTSYAFIVGRLERGLHRVGRRLGVDEDERSPGRLTVMSGRAPPLLERATVCCSDEIAVRRAFRLSRRRCATASRPTCRERRDFAARSRASRSAASRLARSACRACSVRRLEARRSAVEFAELLRDRRYDFADALARPRPPSSRAARSSRVPAALRSHCPARAAPNRGARSAAFSPRAASHAMRAPRPAPKRKIAKAPPTSIIAPSPDSVRRTPSSVSKHRRRQSCHVRCTLIVEERVPRVVVNHDVV